MSKRRDAQRIALQGSMRAVSGIEAKGEPKIGIEEFMAVCWRFGFSKKTLDTLRATAEKEEWGEGPFFANYYSTLDETSVQAFERVAREIFGVRHVIGLSSGTGALHAAFVGVGVGPGTEVICPAIGFFATASVVDMLGATPVFCDVDESLHMDPAKIEPLITERTVAIAPTHIMGGVCDMAAIMRVARKHKLKVVEDCAQSCGGQFRGKYVGTFGDYGCFSISCYKIVGAGEGGLLLARNQRLWDRASQLAECGGLWRPDRFGPERYRGELFSGTNYRMSELEATIDAVQLKKMPRNVKRFRTAKARVLKRLEPFREIMSQRSNDPEGEVGYMLRFFPETIALGERIVKGLRALKVDATMRGSSGAPDWHVYGYMFPLAKRHGIQRGMCPVADDLFDRMVTIGINQWYTAADCRELADRINAVLSACCTADENACTWWPS
ncbi:MAG TPA: DegT/DnrJ/EryC1/StrS family aminotransferase [Candidatus Hydrogenedentes bacterium]|nr:DegT/DnrJ/EryC1/StrS family aminotransferase [Candidatus Hydrogenedentota bacterium]